MYLKHVVRFINLSKPESDLGSVGPVSDASILNEGGDEAEGDEGAGKSDDDDTSDEVNEGDEGKDEKDDTEDGEDSEEGDGEEEESDEEDEEESEEDGEEEEEEEDGTTERLSTYTDIKKKFPDFFKQFPDIKAAIFRDEKYGEMFGSIKEAESAKVAADVYHRMSDDIIGEGNIVPLLETVSKQKPEAFEKIAFSILPFLEEKNPTLYAEAAAPVIKNVVRNALRATNGKTDQASKDLRNSALHIHQFIFGDLDAASTVKGESAGRKIEKSDEVKKLEDKLAAREQADHDNFLNEVDGRYTKAVNKIVGEALAKDDRLSEWAKNKITSDLIKEVKKQMDGDKRFITAINSLVNQAKRSGYKGDFKSRIINTALDRAKPLIPAIRQKLVAEALGKKPRVDDGGKKVVNGSSKSNFKPRNVAGSSSKSGTTQQKKASANPDLDILRS